MDVFISYNWSIKEKVKELYQELINLNYKVWLDDNELNDNNLNNNNNNNNETANGIKNSKIFISCITNDYCKCNSCNLEIEYALAKKKQIIALIIDNNIDTAKIDEIQISGRENQTSVIGYLTSCIYINCSNNIDWPKENKDEIQKAINKCLEVYYIYILKYLF
jgi:hypothetical protein